jgi:hypothetical protein
MIMWIGQVEREMSLAVRFEKLKFIVSELESALYLAQHAPDDFVARTLSRHVAVRAENFIAHARGLRTPLNRLGVDTRNFHKTKEVYAEYFEEYFHLVRHKLGAHVQDLDFGDRIELWNDIEIVKIGFFVSGAREIYESLDVLNIPGYSSYTNPLSLTDEELAPILNSFKRSGETRPWTEFGADPLAMTRPNTASILNMSPIHTRAGQLVLIRRWVTAQRSLAGQLEAHVELARILKSRLITDIVSFFDGLVTRPVAAGAPQRMEGLDSLLRNEGLASDAIGQFLHVFTIDALLVPARTVRDHIGAHVEIDESVGLSALLYELDDFDMEAGITFFDRLVKVFEKVCYDVLFLRTYAIDGQRIYGVTPNSLSVIAFDGRDPAPATLSPPVPDYNNDRAYQVNLRLWTMGDEHSQQDARYFFWHAFSNSDIIESFDEIEHLGVGSRLSRHHLRRAHQFIIDALCAHQSGGAFVKLLELILACRSSDPHMLAEVLIRYNEAAPRLYEWQLCYCAGELASWPHARVSNFLTERAVTNLDWNVQFHALLARFKIYVRTEGLARINRSNPFRSYAAEIAPLVAGLPETRRLVCAITFVSYICHPAMGIFAKPLHDDFAALRDEIDALCRCPTLTDICMLVIDIVANLQKAYDYVGVCLVIADAVKAVGMHALADELLTAACAGWVVAAHHSGAVRNLSACFLRRGDFANAFQIADQLAARNPDDIDLQIFAVQILVNTPDASAEAMQRVARIRADYKLSDAQRDVLLAFEAHLASRAIPQTCG